MKTLKKTIMIIVEGPSDSTALGNKLTNYYSNDSVFVLIMHGDITTRNGIDSNNIKSEHCEAVNRKLRMEHLKVTDIKKIIHLVDMDGAFIPNRNIIQSEDIHSIKYSETHILTTRKSSIENRNAQKRRSLDKLMKCNNLTLAHGASVPYRIYYMSCNLDHVLYDKINSDDTSKRIDAIRFSRKYSNDVESFIHFISDSPFSVKLSYREPWKYIQQEFNSMCRHTNLGLCFI